MTPSTTVTPPFVSTGNLPGPDPVRLLVEAAYAHFREDTGGKLADYIPALAEADPSAFGICVANTRGDTLMIGDAAQPFSIQSVSKPFVFALICDALGPSEAAARGRRYRVALQLRHGDGTATRWHQ
ncbi:glutaminase [Cupriavidus pauculus]|uniref:glutaminase n=1 Tax=Cupriavidus pauculus TaxID=82633 RepID=UPI002155B590|nr:glutaminase [Cupriavidus pauculus]